MLQLQALSNNTELKTLGIFLLGNGHPLSIATHENIPWSSYSTNFNQPPTVLPTVWYNEQGKGGEMTDLYMMIPNLTSHQSGYTLHPHHPMKDSFSQLECETLRTDPFFIISRLYSTASLSWAQMLNFLEDDITNCPGVEADTSLDALRQVRYTASLIQRFETFIQSDLDAIKQRGCSSWPQSTQDVPNEKEELQRIQTDLCTDYESLVNQCNSLSRRCEATADILLSTVSTVEAQKSIDLSIEVAMLTKLGFVIISLSFVASVFGGRLLWCSCIAFSKDAPKGNLRTKHHMSSIYEYI